MSAEEEFSKEAAETVVTFLKSNVPKSDVPNIENELKQNFVLAKRQSKIRKQKPKQKKQCLTRKLKKSLGYYDIPRDGIAYDDILAMNTIWNGYMEQLLDLQKPNSVPSCSSRNWECFSQSVYKADFHGGLLKVIRSKCPSYVGKMGICVMDTKNTFKIVSKDNVTTTIPKKSSVFEIYLKNMKITLFGKHLCLRPAERSNKRFKGHLHPDL